jgi:hypothetical protein
LDEIREETLIPKETYYEYDDEGTRSFDKEARQV